MFSRSFLQTSNVLSTVGRRMLSQRVSGTVKWFNPKKGFGFIQTANNGEVFVHQSSIKADGYRSLGDGEAVEFEIVQDEANNRSRAANVTGPNGSKVQGAMRRFQSRDNQH